MVTTAIGVSEKLTKKKKNLKAKAAERDVAKGSENPGHVVGKPEGCFPTRGRMHAEDVCDLSSPLASGGPRDAKQAGGGDVAGLSTHMLEELVGKGWQTDWVKKLREISVRS